MLNRIDHRKYIVTVLGAFILMLFALYDNFPILNNDTGAYINSGFDMRPPIDRPIFYGLFIRITSLGASLWLTVFFQCLILSYTTIKFTRKLIPSIDDLKIIGFILFISLFTICGWFAGQLMADIFTAILILSATTYLFFENTTKEKVTLLGIILLSVLTHNSNFLLLLSFSLLSCLFVLFKPAIRKYLSRSLVLLSVSVLGLVSLCVSNQLAGNGFTASKATHVFVMGKLVESGVLRTYLDKACPVKHYQICDYVDQLPPAAWQFHYDETSPLQLTGGWEANKKEYNEIIKDIFSRPKYYPFIAYKSIEATARQLSLFNIDGIYILPWMKFDTDNASYKAIEKYYPHELNQLKTSRQNTKTLNIAFYDNLFVVVLVLSCLLILFFINGKHKKEFLMLVSILAVFILMNAFITATLSSVNARFNSRVIWLVPFLNMLMLYKVLSGRFSKEEKL